MKKVFLFVVMVSVLGLSIIGNAAEVKRPGLIYKGWIFSATKQALDPKADYTNGIAPAIADNIRGNNNSNAATQIKKAVLENYSTHDIMVELQIGYFPGGVEAYNITTGIQNIPGYQPRTIHIKKKSAVVVELMPGDWDVQVYDLSKRTGYTKVRNTSLHVDVLPGNNVSQLANVNCDVIFFHR